MARSGATKSRRGTAGCISGADLYAYNYARNSVWKVKTKSAKHQIYLLVAGDRSRRPGRAAKASAVG